MSEPYIDDGQDFYLHARPTHQFAVMEFENANQAALEFTVLELDHQIVTVYDNWKLEVQEEPSNNNAVTNDGPIVHENAQEQDAPEDHQHPPPQYMNQQQNSQEYWEQQEQLREQELQRQQNY